LLYKKEGKKLSYEAKSECFGETPSFSSLARHYLKTHISPLVLSFVGVLYLFIRLVKYEH